MEKCFGCAKYGVVFQMCNVWRDVAVVMSMERIYRCVKYGRCDPGGQCTGEGGVPHVPSMGDVTQVSHVLEKEVSQTCQVWRGVTDVPSMERCSRCAMYGEVLQMCQVWRGVTDVPSMERCYRCAKYGGGVTDVPSMGSCYRCAKYGEVLQMCQVWGVVPDVPSMGAVTQVFHVLEKVYQTDQKM